MAVKNKCDLSFFAYLSTIVVGAAGQSLHGSNYGDARLKFSPQGGSSVQLHGRLLQASVLCLPAGRYFNSGSATLAVTLMAELKDLTPPVAPSKSAPRGSVRQANLRTRKRDLESLRKIHAGDAGSSSAPLTLGEAGTACRSACARSNLVGRGGRPSSCPRIARTDQWGCRSQRRVPPHGGGYSERPTSYRAGSRQTRRSGDTARGKPTTRMRQAGGFRI